MDIDRLSVRAETLILDLVRECAHIGIDVPAPGMTDDEIIDAFRGNHPDGVIKDAAAGEVAALIELRTDCGLPLTV